MTPVKIVHIIASLGRGGKERQLSTIYKYSNPSRMTTKIIYFAHTEINYIGEYRMEKDIYLCQAKSVPGRIRELRGYLKREKPSAIMSWGIQESVVGLLLSVLTGIPFLNGSIRHGIRLKNKTHLFRSYWLHISPHIVANSKAGLAANGLKRGFVLYNGIDKNLTGLLSEEEKIKRKEQLLKIPAGTVTFVSVANLVPYKDYFSVLEALKQIRDMGYRFFYIIIGDGPLRDPIEQRIESLGLKDWVKITGRISGVKEYLEISDIFIHSSKGEGCSNAILEAMFNALPVIASNTGGTPEIVTGKNGLLFEFRNQEELKSHILKLIENQSLREEMGKNSFETAISSYTAGRMIENYYAIMEKIIKK